MIFFFTFSTQVIFGLYRLLLKSPWSRISTLLMEALSKWRHPCLNQRLWVTRTLTRVGYYTRHRWDTWTLYHKIAKSKQQTKVVKCDLSSILPTRTFFWIFKFNYLVSLHIYQHKHIYYTHLLNMILRIWRTFQSQNLRGVLSHIQSCCSPIEPPTINHILINIFILMQNWPTVLTILW